MIVKIAEIYNRVSQKNNLDPEIVSSLGSIVFSTLLENLMKPHEISYELPKLGAFVMKHKNFEEYYRHYMRFVRTGAIKNQVDIERVKGLRERIDKFKEAKKEVKERKNEYWNTKALQSS